jgi:Mlc titration factor MtfA (ptsG expression regulator)
MNIGLSPEERNRIEKRFLTVRQTGLWTDDYAMTNAMEFWAVMSQFYFWAAPEHSYSAFHHIPNGPDTLRRYDPQTFALLDSIYRGSANLR